MARGCYFWFIHNPQQYPTTTSVDPILEVHYMYELNEIKRITESCKSRDTNTIAYQM